MVTPRRFAHTTFNPPYSGVLLFTPANAHAHKSHWPAPDFQPAHSPVCRAVVHARPARRVCVRRHPQHRQQRSHPDYRTGCERLGQGGSNPPALRLDAATAYAQLCTGLLARWRPGARDLQDHQHRHPCADRLRIGMVFQKFAADLRSPRRKGTMVRSCTCLGLGRPSLAGVLGAVRGTAIPDYGDAVPGTGTVGLPESSTGTDRRPPRAQVTAAGPSAVGCCHVVQGRFSLAARVHSCAVADRTAIFCEHYALGRHPASRIPDCDTCGCGSLSFVGDSSLLAVECVPRPRLFDPGAFADRSQSALPVPVADLGALAAAHARSEEHTSELQSLMRISYAVFCLKKKTKHIITSINIIMYT